MLWGRGRVWPLWISRTNLSWCQPQVTSQGCWRSITSWQTSNKRRSMSTPRNMSNRSFKMERWSRESRDHNWMKASDRSSWTSRMTNLSASTLPRASLRRDIYPLTTISTRVTRRRTLRTKTTKITSSESSRRKSRTSLKMRRMIMRLQSILRECTAIRSLSSLQRLHPNLKLT